MEVLELHEKEVVLFLWTWSLRVVEVGMSGYQHFLNRRVTSWDWHFKRITVAWKTWFIFLFLCSFISSNASFITHSLCVLGQVSDTLQWGSQVQNVGCSIYLSCSTRWLSQGFLGKSTAQDSKLTVRRWAVEQGSREELATAASQLLPSQKLLVLPLEASSACPG